MRSAAHTCDADHASRTRRSTRRTCAAAPHACAALPLPACGLSVCLMLPVGWLYASDRICLPFDAPAPSPSTSTLSEPCWACCASPSPPCCACCAVLPPPDAIAPRPIGAPSVLPVAAPVCVPAVCVSDNPPANESTTCPPSPTTSCPTATVSPPDPCNPVPDPVVPPSCCAVLACVTDSLSCLLLSVVTRLLLLVSVLSALSWDIDGVSVSVVCEDGGGGGAGGPGGGRRGARGLRGGGGGGSGAYMPVRGSTCLYVYTSLYPSRPRYTYIIPPAHTHTHTHTHARMCTTAPSLLFPFGAHAVRGSAWTDVCVCVCVCVRAYV